MTIPLPVEFLLFPFLGLLLYSVCLNGTMIFDDLEVLPNAKNFPFRWWTITHAGRPLTALVLALLARWPGSTRSVHVFNVLLHSVNAIVVDEIARALGGDEIAGLAAGIFFLGMPFAANTVAYMSGMAGLWVGLFGLSGVLSILKGWPLLALPFLGLAYLAKEDGIGFATTFLALLIGKHEFVIAASLILLGTIGAIHQRAHLHRLFKGSGDVEMANVGLPVSLPQPQHGLTVAVETLWRLPFWAFGLKQSPYHGSGIPVPKWPKILAAIGVLLAAASLFYRW